VCPNWDAMANPVPSLPVLGTDSPPVAITTAEAAIVSPDASRTPQGEGPAGGSIDATLTANRQRTPCRRQAATRASRTSRARFDRGKSLSVSGSSTSGMPRSSSKNCRCPESGQESRIFFMEWGEEAVTKREGCSVPGSTLHLPPPLIRIFLPPSFVRSNRSTSAPCREAKIAAMRPAAPAPITTMGWRCSSNPGPSAIPRISPASIPK